MSSLPLVACQKKVTEDKAAPEKPVEEIVPPLSEDFLTRALSALKSRLTPETEILEIRATGSSFSVQLRATEEHPAADKKKAIKPGALVQLDYVERPTEVGQPPIGRIFGPEPIPTRGQGEVKDNVFPLAEIDLSKMGKAFQVARLAIDPEDGKVTHLVVRRYLPFSARVRARIFVESPRMGGSIDVNEKGVPLKR